MPAVAAEGAVRERDRLVREGIAGVREAGRGCEHHLHYLAGGGTAAVLCEHCERYGILARSGEGIAGLLTCCGVAASEVPAPTDDGRARGGAGIGEAGNGTCTSVTEGEGRVQRVHEGQLDSVDRCGAEEITRGGEEQVHMLQQGVRGARLIDGTGRGVVRQEDPGTVGGPLHACSSGPGTGQLHVRRDVAGSDVRARVRRGRLVHVHQYGVAVRGATHVAGGGEHETQLLEHQVGCAGHVCRVQVRSIREEGTGAIGGPRTAAYACDMADQGNHGTIGA